MPTPLSLKGLQAFESAARTGSFAAAAAELSVSPAAISQSVRNLEDQLGKQLFRRINRGIALTEAGLEILPRLSTVFEEISNVSDQLTRGENPARLTLSVPLSMSMSWLPKHLKTFVDQSGDTTISIRGEDDPVSFERNAIDIRISFGPFHYTDHETEEIVTDSVFPVCSPDLVKTYGPFESPADLLKAPLIHTDWGPTSAAFPNWRDFLSKTSVVASHAVNKGVFTNYSQSSVEMAKSGLGIALSQGLFVKHLIEEGSLIRPIDDAIALSQPYCLTVPRRSAQRPVVTSCQTWLRQQIRHSTF